jgi:hypothetical protein
VANIIVADRVALVKGGALEFAGADLGNIVGQLGAHRFLKFYFFEHGNFSLI